MSPQSPKPLPLAIIGGGLAGITLSIALTRLSVPHKLYESAKCFAEIGAGIACGPNAVAALALIDPRLRECYEHCATYNESPAQRNMWMNYRWGMADPESGKDFGDVITSIEAYGHGEAGRSCCHRAHFLEEAIRLIPAEVPEFNKTLTKVEAMPDESRVTIFFADGTHVSASAVIGCDGIKSTVRSILLENILPEAIKPVFAGEYAYRCMFPRETAERILGPEIVGAGNIFCGDEGCVVAYPVDKGRLYNLVGMRRKTIKTWDHDDWLAPVSRETMLEDFRGWGSPLLEMLKLAKDPSQWAIFDAPDAPTYTEGLICLVGDAAHASTPNQGAGAAMAFEDAYILGNLLRDASDAQSIKNAFKAFDQVRRPRTQQLVATSRTAGEVYELVHEGVGRDFQKIKENLESRHAWIWSEDLPAELERAREIMQSA